jgi:hypothetical protein
MDKHIYTVPEVVGYGRKFYTLFEGDENKNKLSTLSLKGKHMYKIIALKNAFIEETKKIEEVQRQIFLSCGAKTNEQGNLVCPEENIEQLNKELDDFTQHDITIEHEMLEFTEEDLEKEIAAEILDLLFPFVTRKQSDGHESHSH